MRQTTDSVTDVNQHQPLTGSVSINVTLGWLLHPSRMRFLPRDASAEHGYEIAFVCLSVRPSVCNDQVPW